MSDELPYRIDLWDEPDRTVVERVLARAVDLALARVIFATAIKDHPGRRLTLARGGEIIADSAK